MNLVFNLSLMLTDNNFQTWELVIVQGLNKSINNLNSECKLLNLKKLEFN